MDRWLILDPTAPPAEATRWVAPRLDRPVRGATIGLRLDRSWRCYETVVDTWTELLEASGAVVDRFVVDARVSTAGDRMRDELDDWRARIDAAVVGLGN